MKVTVGWIRCSFFELTSFSFGAGLWLGLVNTGKSHANSICLSYDLDLRMTLLDAAMHALQQPRALPHFC